MPIVIGRKVLVNTVNRTRAAKRIWKSARIWLAAAIVITIKHAHMLFDIVNNFNTNFSLIAEELVMQPGTYNYDYHCNLPEGLPTSLEADIGHIRYMVRVILDIPLETDTEFSEMFTVIKPLNLNLNPANRVSATGAVTMADF